MEREKKPHGPDLHFAARQIWDKLRTYVGSYLPADRSALRAEGKYNAQSLLRGIAFGILSFVLAGAQFAMGSYPF